MLTTLNFDNLADAPFHEKVALLRELFGFTLSTFASALNVNEKTIRRWESGEHSPRTGSNQAIEALTTIAETLGDVFEPDSIPGWARTPNPALAGERPMDFVKKPGGIYLLANKLGAVGR